MKNISRRLLYLSTFVVFIRFPVAEASDIREKEAITPSLFHEVARQQQVPASILYAIVLAETMTQVGDNGHPWPWTINHAGKSHFFESKIDAVIYARSLINKEDVNFDVGLGQLNWRFHGKSFAKLNDAFDPKLNLTVAAKFLRNQFNRSACKGWHGAIGCYHRPNQQEQHHKYRAKNYTKRVIKIWNELELRNGKKNVRQ